MYLFLLGKEELDRKLLARKPSSANGSYRFDHVIEEKEISPERKVSPDEQSRNSVEVVIRSAGYSSRSFALATKDVARQGIFHICEMEPACKFTGRVTGSDGKPVKDARVRMEDAVLSSRWKEINSARTDAEGKFEIDDLMASQTEQSSRIPRHVVKLAGRYGSEICIQQPSLLVEHPDFAARHVYVDTMPGNVDVQLKLPAILEGRVVFNGTGKPVANARIQATTVIDISPRANSFVAKSYDVSTTTDNGGNYRFAALPASRYELWANVPNWTCAGIGAIQAVANKTTRVPDLKVAKGGIVRLRLVEKKSGKPISLEPNAKVSFCPVPIVLGSGVHANMHYTDAIAAGRTELRVCPGKNDILLQTFFNGQGDPWTSVGRNEFVIADGQTIDLDVYLSRQLGRKSARCKFARR